MREKVRVIYFKYFLKTICATFYISKTSVSLVKHFYFSVFCNIFCYTQLDFVFYLLRDYYILSDRIVTFFPLFQKGFDTFHELFSLKPFLFFYIISSWWIFKHALYTKNTLYIKRVLLQNCLSFFIVLLLSLSV